MIPRMLWEEILQELHAGSLEGQLGEDKTIGKVWQHLYWPGIQQYVRQWIHT